MSHVPPAKRHPYDQWSPDARALDLVGDKWTLLIVRDLITGPRRFVELQRVLPGISTEQLRSRLNRMVADGMLTRQRYREVPPRVDYELTERARELAPVLGALARWGHDWAWGPPRPSEQIDITAVFRLLPGLIDGATAPAGTVTLGVHDSRVSPVTRLLLAGSGASISETSAERVADAAMEGDTAGWIRALGPVADLSGLRMTGREDLRIFVLDQLMLGRRAAGQIAEPASELDDTPAAAAS